MKAKDALYTEAEAVWREAFGESIRVSRAGGSDEPTDVMLKTSEGHFLQDSLAKVQSLRERGLHAEGADPQIKWLVRLPDRSKGGSVVAVAVCADSRSWGFYEDDRLAIPGKVAVDEVYFGSFEGHLKIIGADGRDEDSCD